MSRKEVQRVIEKIPKIYKISLSSIAVLGTLIGINFVARNNVDYKLGFLRQARFDIFFHQTK